MGMIQNNVFENSNSGNALSHAEMDQIFTDAKSLGSLKESVLSHAADYGIDNIDYLYPENQLVGDPSTVKRNDEWVDVVLNNATKKPFSRIKSLAFDITAAQARAKGYVKNNKKVDEVIVALKRVTNPQTIYKKQKLDRDDINDITDFDVVAYLRQEMKGLLQEELARAILIGDGRLADDADKINEQNIRPIVSDDDVYTIKSIVTYPVNPTNKDIADKIIDASLRARKDYKGSGSPMFFCSSEVLTDMLLAQDTIGRRLYDTEASLASALRVTKIQEVPVLEGATYTNKSDSKVYDILGIVVNLKDYVIGADKKGETAMFDDFDIDYNQNKYLIETRSSGALIKPYSAIAILKEKTTVSG
jgi:hypothetical protein